MPDKYTEYLIKLDEAKQSIKEDDSLRLFVIDAKNIFSELKSLDDIAAFQKINLGLSILGAIVFIAHILLRGFWAGVVGLGLIVISFIFVKIYMDLNVKKLNEQAFDLPEGFVNSKDLSSFLDYLSAGIRIKALRYKILSTLLTIVLPLIMIALGEMILNQVMGWVNVAIALAIGVLAGYFVFRKELSIINDLSDQVERTKSLL